MIKKICRRVSKLQEWVVWTAGTLVGLGVGFSAISGALAIPFIPQIVMVIAGWVTVIATLWASVFKILELFGLR